jgi:translation initiation factor 2B subunit (eIF-2B alpha/beta/delta family)
VNARAERFLAHSRDAVRRLGQIGAELVRPGQTIMMHSFSDSVLSVFEAAAMGKEFAVICTESRPLREGRYAASRLSAAGIPVTFVTDASMAEVLPRADWVLAGADSIAMNGAAANKMGTNLLSIAAAHFGKPLYIASEVLKLRRNAGDGSAIGLEVRPPAEVVDQGDFMDAGNVTVVNQFFDLTPPERIRGIVTEQGVFEPAQIGRAWQALQAEFEM